MCGRKKEAVSGNDQLWRCVDCVWQNIAEKCVERGSVDRLNCFVVKGVLVVEDERLENKRR